MLAFELVGDAQLAASLSELPASIFAILAQRVAAGTIKVQAHIIRDKLSGQVLAVRSGALRRSIQQVVSVAEPTVTGRVFSSGDVKYAGIQEYGGRTSPHDIFPKKAEALAFVMGGKTVFAKVVHHPGSQIPARSFMRTGLADLAPEIEADIKRAVIAQVRATLERPA